MLQFDDASLARLIRAVRAVPYDKRKIFLKKLGAAIDPSPALRRYRNRNGPLPLVVVDAADSRRDLAFFLKAHGVLAYDRVKTERDKLAPSWPTRSSLSFYHASSPMIASPSTRELCRASEPLLASELVA